MYLDSFQPSCSRVDKIWCKSRIPSDMKMGFNQGWASSSFVIQSRNESGLSSAHATSHVASVLSIARETAGRHHSSNRRFRRANQSESLWMSVRRPQANGRLYRVMIKCVSCLSSATKPHQRPGNWTKPATETYRESWTTCSPESSIPVISTG